MSQRNFFTELKRRNVWGAHCSPTVCGRLACWLPRPRGNRLGSGDHPVRRTKTKVRDDEGVIGPSRTGNCHRLPRRSLGEGGKIRLAANSESIREHAGRPRKLSGLESVRDTPEFARKSPAAAPS
jgi:hypothetical protein